LVNLGHLLLRNIGKGKRQRYPTSIRGTIQGDSASFEQLENPRRAIEAATGAKPGHGAKILRRSRPFQDSRNRLSPGDTKTPTDRQVRKNARLAAESLELQLINVRMIHVPENLCRPGCPANGILLIASVDAALTIDAPISIHRSFLPRLSYRARRANGFALPASDAFFLIHLSQKL
jgi:hypothetical protein